MIENRQVLINIHSDDLVQGQPKLPTASQLEYGEIAVSYAKSAETLSIRNSEDEIVTFSCDDKFNESFRVMSKAMCDLDDRVLALEELSAITIGDLVKTDAELGNVTTSGKVVDALLVKDINNQVDNIEASAGTFNTRITNLETSATSIDTRVTNLETSAGTLDTRLSNLEASAITIDDIVNTEEAFSALTASGKVVDAKLIRDIIYDNEEVTSQALNNLNDKIAELSGATPSLETTLAVSGDSAITVTIGDETSNALVVPYAVSASTITNTVTTESELSALTQTGSYVDAKLIRDIIYDNEEVTSQALNGLNEDVISLNDEIETIKTNISGLTDTKEDKSNKVSAVTSGSTDEQYPTAKCLYDLTTILTTITRRVRRTSFDLNVLKQAVAEQNLEKYGLKVGDETTINGYTYVIAGLNPMAGPYTPYRVNVPHVGLIVIPHTTQVWNVAGNTYTGADGRGAGYKNCDLHYYLKNTTLPHVQNDLGSGNLIAHNKSLSSDVNTTGYNRYGTNTGCASSWAWEENCYISALSEIQVYGSIVWSSAGYDTGEACRQLDVFRVYNMNEIFKWEYPWLRDIASASYAAYASYDGSARNGTASNARCVAALILFH